MGIDYSRGCANFRDVGEFVNLIGQTELLPTRRLLRGGKLDAVSSLDAIGRPQTIVNVRRGPDQTWPRVAQYHCPIPKGQESYDTQQKDVRKWLNQVVKIFEDPQLRYPVLIHCTSGKDRTGIVIAALLWLLQIPDAIIIEEYLLSEGDVDRKWITLSLEGFRRHPRFIDRVKVDIVCRNILGLSDHP